MPSFTLRVGLLLVVFGIASYVITGARSWTALIPAIVGLLLALCAVLARRGDAMRRHAMHAAAVVALIGLAGSITGLASVPALLSGAPVARPAAVVSRAGMAILLLVYLYFSIRSFVEARRARTRA